MLVIASSLSFSFNFFIPQSYWLNPTGTSPEALYVRLWIALANVILPHRSISRKLFCFNMIHLRFGMAKKMWYLWQTVHCGMIISGAWRPALMDNKGNQFKQNWRSHKSGTKGLIAACIFRFFFPIQTSQFWWCHIHALYECFDCFGTKTILTCMPNCAQQGCALISGKQNYIICYRRTILPLH